MPMFSSAGDAIQQDVRLHLGHGAVALGGAQAGEVQLAHLLGVHALGRQGAQAALQARVDLLLHQRLGHRKRVALSQRGEEPVLGLALHAAALAAGHVLADAGLQLRHALVLAQLLLQSRRPAPAGCAS